MPDGVIAHSPDGYFHEPSIVSELNAFPGLVGLDLAKESPPPRPIAGTRPAGSGVRAMARSENPEFHIVALDYGAKRNILRSLADEGARVTVDAGDHHRRRSHGNEARRHLPLQRSGRSGGDRQICGADDPEG